MMRVRDAPVKKRRKVIVDFIIIDFFETLIGGKGGRKTEVLFYLFFSLL